MGFWILVGVPGDSPRDLCPLWSGTIAIFQWLVGDPGVIYGISLLFQVHFPFLRKDNLFNLVSLMY